MERKNPLPLEVASEILKGRELREEPQIAARNYEEMERMHFGSFNFVCFQIKLCCRDGLIQRGLKELGQPIATNFFPPILPGSTMCESYICVMQMSNIAFLKNSLLQKITFLDLLIVLVSSIFLFTSLFVKLFQLLWALFN